MIGIKTGKLVEVLSSARLWVTLFLGFSSGLPLLATGSTLQAWMKDEKVDLAIIGLYSLVGIPYTLKFLWAPLIDRFIPPFWGRRRGWILISQIALVLSLVGLAFSQPANHPWLTAMMALMVAFSSATQDIVLDAHRRDTLRDEELGLGSALFVNGYRIGMLVSGAAALMMADHIPWREVYLAITGFVLVGMIAGYFAPEPERPNILPTSLKEAVFLPFVEFFSRPRALLMLAFVLLYKLGDSMASSMTTPFVLEIGFSKTELGAIVKTFGLVSLIVGGLLGGGVIVKTGINKSLWIFGVLQALSILTFFMLAQIGHNTSFLAFAVAAENLSFGMGTSAYVAYMASLCNRAFSATQYALLTSLMGVARVWASSSTGYLATFLGWELFFVFCCFLALPGMVLLFWVAPWCGDDSLNGGSFQSGNTSS